MTGEIHSTITGLSEGILWDFKTHSIAERLLGHYQIPEKMLPNVVPVFGNQGSLSAESAKVLGLTAGIPIGYRAGDQPNNAMSLKVLRPGEVAATGGTSGVVYAVAEQPVFDPLQRVNSFAHVNYTPECPLTGVLLCINGAGSLYRWIREHLSDAMHLSQAIQYSEMEVLAASVPIGSAGLCILPFGNGAERLLGNQNLGAQIMGLHFNHHKAAHFYRAALEGVAFAFVMGMEVMLEMGIPIHTLRVGNDNLFQSAVFANTIAHLMGVQIEVYSTNGAVGAAKGAGVAAGFFSSVEKALEGLTPMLIYQPNPDEQAVYQEAFMQWRKYLPNEVNVKS